MVSSENGTGAIITPERAMTEHAARVRRERKPTLGEVEDAMNDFARKMLEQYGPMAVELRTLRLELQAIQRRLGPVVGSGDVE